MEYFPIVQALCRAAMANPNPAIRKQIERLRDELEKGGDKKSAQALRRVLSAAERTKDVTPSKLARSRAHLPGEVLTKNTSLPVDRESATPLAELVFPSDIDEEPPLFNPVVTAAVNGLLEEWSNLEALQKVGVEPARTCLIYGVPGAGKTRLALWMAAQLDIPVVLAKIDGLVSSFLGTTARNIGSLFSFVSRYRCILLLDEFDAVAKLRDDPQEVGEIKRVVNALLQNLDSREPLGFTIGITNHARLLDPAVWRRFEVQLEIPKPDFKVRADIARQFMRPLNAPESHLSLIAWFTDGGTGAEIEALVRTYKKSFAINSENQRYIIETLQQFATLNSGRLSEDRKELVFGEGAKLFRALKKDRDLNFNLSDIGEITGKDKSTISRHLSRFEASEA